MQFDMLIEYVFLRKYNFSINLNSNRGNSLVRSVIDKKVDENILSINAIVEKNNWDTLINKLNENK